MTRARILLSILCLGFTLSTVWAIPFPLPAPAVVPTDEANAPFVIPDGFTQSLVVDRNTLNAQGLPATFGIWDMIDIDPTGRFIFVPSEVGSGAGVFRYDTHNRRHLTLMAGNASGVRTADPKDFSPLDDDFSRFDPCSLTPWGTAIAGEETTGGRLFEILNPYVLPGGIHPRLLKFLPPPHPFVLVKWRSNIPAVAHEGLRFDKDNTLYFIDEDNSGSIYKFVPLRRIGRDDDDRDKGDDDNDDGDDDESGGAGLARGQSFVLKVNAFNGNPAEVWNSATNIGTVRSGPATWVPITDEKGNALTAADPFAFVTTTGGRTAADELGGTPYGRPEDMHFGTLANGNEIVYIAITSENLVIGIELVSDATAIVHDFVRRGVTIDESTGLPVAGGSAGLNSPDNMEVGADGTVYIIEDSLPGDIWRARDANNDGVAESIGRWISLGVDGSEPTGMISDPKNPKRFYVVVQHPSSDNDAIWAITTP
jgi:hypothetical protein